MMLSVLLLISGGAALGAGLRWGLGLWLNPLFAMFSFGTLVANYFGCFLIGLLLALFWHFPQISNEWKLFLVTGFLGSLTTFSSFSAEVMENLLNGKWMMGLGVIAAHLFGSLLFTWFGVLFMRACLD